MVQAKAFPVVESSPCEVCHLRNEQTRDVATSEDGLQGVCAKYAANSCCSPETAQSIQDSTGDIYGPEYNWQKCYFYHQGLNDTLTANSTLSAKCVSSPFVRSTSYAASFLHTPADTLAVGCAQKSS